MTKEEVLVFKQFEVFHGDQVGRMPVFHTGFNIPNTPIDVEKRTSFEYRMACARA